MTPSGGPQGTAKQARDAIKAAGRALAGRLSRSGGCPVYFRLPGLARVVSTVAYRREKEKQGLLDFDDLLLITRDLLADEAGGAA